MNKNNRIESVIKYELLLKRKQTLTKKTICIQFTTEEQNQHN